MSWFGAGVNALGLFREWIEVPGSGLRGGGSGHQDAGAIEHMSLLEQDYWESTLLAGAGSCRNYVIVGFLRFSAGKQRPTGTLLSG